MRSSRQAFRSAEEVPTTKWIEHPQKHGRFLPVHTRPHRLPGVDYAAASLVCFVTYNLAESESILTCEVAVSAWSALLEARDHLGIALHAACLMPDHMHLLLSPPGNGKTVGQIVRSIKIRQQQVTKAATGIWLNWQLDFFDHVLGRSPHPTDEFDSIVAYIHNNPVAGGLVMDSSANPYVI